MFQNNVIRPPCPALPPRQPDQGENTGKTIRLQANCFRLTMQDDAAIHEYMMVIEPQPTTIKQERAALAVVWKQLETHLDPFVVRCPGQVFSTKSVSTPLVLEACATHGSSEMVRVTLESARVYKAKEVNEGAFLGNADVVLQHVARKIVVGQFQEKVGRRYFDNKTRHEVDGDKSDLTIFRGVYCALHRTRDGPQLQIDVAIHAKHRSVIDSLASGLEVDTLNYDDPGTRAEFRKSCLGATVATLYAERLYRIKAVHFDMHPGDTFTPFIREERVYRTISFAEYLRLYYETDVVDHSQPMLEAFAEKDTEKVFLVPECCALTGVHDDFRKSEKTFKKKLAPQERISTITSLVHASLHTDPSSTATSTLDKWNMSLDATPVAIDARPLEVPTVSFREAESHPIEEGSFQRCMRNGLRCPAKLDKWLLIYPDADVPVVDIWLRSLIDVAEVAFGMSVSTPTHCVCSDQERELPGKLDQNLDPSTQFVLLLTPQKDSRRVYQIFKHATCCRYPCITQAVRSETIRKRQSIAAVLTRIVLQMNAKFVGPLWHININLPCTAPIMEMPTTVVGVDVFRNGDNEPFLGFAASLDTHCSEYYSMAYKLECNKGDYSSDMSVRLQDCFRNALLQFTKRNGILPNQLLVYRASTNEQQWSALLASELQAFKQVFDAVRGGVEGPEAEVGTAAPYEPLIAFVAISRGTVVRFFPTVGDRNKNLEPGTVIDSPSATPATTRSFYLVNQFSQKGTASPTHYTVLYDSIGIPLTSLQNLTFRLSFMYFNCTNSVKLPAPAQYAKKIAHFIGTAVRDQPAERLLGTLFYL